MNTSTLVSIDHSAAETAATALKALADPLRLRLLAAIHGAPHGEATVTDLQPLTDVTAPTLSHHLKVMKEAGVLESERRATWVYYMVASEFASSASALLEGFVPSVARKAARKDLGHGLSDVDRALDDAAADLAERFQHLEASLVTSIVRESYASLAAKAAIPDHLVALTYRFARQRLEDIGHSKTDSHKPHVLFVCVANAGRSQLAAALLARHAGDQVVVRSAGSAPAADVHEAVRPHLEELGAPQPFPKPLTDDAVRAADVVVTMGCGDVCPVIPGVAYEDWEIADPSLASAEDVQRIRDDIESRVVDLIDRLLTKA